MIRIAPELFGDSLILSSDEPLSVSNGHWMVRVDFLLDGAIYRAGWEVAVAHLDLQDELTAKPKLTEMEPIWNRYSAEQVQQWEPTVWFSRGSTRNGCLWVSLDRLAVLQENYVAGLEIGARSLWSAGADCPFYDAKNPEDRKICIMPLRSTNFDFEPVRLALEDDSSNGR